MKKMTGYLCRWCLLALSAALVLASSVAIVAETTGMPGDVANDMVLSDALWARPGPFRLALFGRITSGWAGWDMDRVLARGADQSLSLVAISPTGIAPSVKGPPDGHSAIDIMPLPYTREAFYRWSVQLVVLTGSERVYMIDAELARPSPSPQMRRLLADLRKRGPTVFICTGTGERFAGFRRLVDRLDDEAMLICTNRHGQLTSLAKYYLDDSGLSNVRKHLTVITDNPACARQTVSMLVRTYLVGRHGPHRAPTSDYLTQHDTVEQLREYLNWTPMD